MSAAPEREPANVRIRRMTGDDLPQVLEIERENFVPPWSDKSFRDMLARPEAVYLVAFIGPEGGRAAGYAGAVVAGDQGDVTNIAVLGRFKRKGIGRQLLRRLIRETEEAGAEELFLEVREHNEPAKQLYLSEGFVPVGRRKRYYTDTKEDAVLMKHSRT